MTIFTELLPVRKSNKRSAIEWNPSTGDTQLAGWVTIHTDRATCVYAIEEFPSGRDDRGFLFRKVTSGTDATAESYSVFCGSRSTCDCKGFRFAGTCKHADSAAALIENGWL